MVTSDAGIYTLSTLALLALAGMLLAMFAAGWRARGRENTDQLGRLQARVEAAEAVARLAYRHIPEQEREQVLVEASRIRREFGAAGGRHAAPAGGESGE